MGEPYELKEKVNTAVLEVLNDDSYDGPIGEQIYDAIGADLTYPEEFELFNWIKAINSGKKIVNP